MPKAIQIDKPGAASAMKWREVPVGKPKKGEVRLRQAAVGLNYIDVYHRMGLYPMPMPLTIGMEGAGVVEALGAGVADLKIGAAARRICRRTPDAGRECGQGAESDR